MDLRQPVLDLFNPSDPVVLNWITQPLDTLPIQPDPTPESYLTARARSINVTVDDPSESDPSQPSTASILHPPEHEHEHEHNAEAMVIETRTNGGGGGEEGEDGAPIDGGVLSSDDDENQVILMDDQDENEDEDPIAGYDEDDVVLLRPERISRDDEPMESATTSRTNSSSPQPNPPSAPPPSSSSTSSLPAPPSSSSAQPTTISPSLLQVPALAPPAKAPLPRIQTLASSSSHTKSKSPSPAPDEAGSPSSTTTPTATHAPTTLAQSDYRPYLSDALITKSPVATANKLIALLSPPSLFIPAPDRSEILHAMNKSGNSRYYAAWVANSDGMDVLAGWLKGLTGKESEPWRATAVVLLEVIKKMEVTKEMLVDKKKKFVMGRLANKVAGNAALTEKVRNLAQSIVDTYSIILGITPAASTSSGGGGSDEGSNKKRKVDSSSTTNGSSSKPPSSSSTKPTTSSSLKPSSSSSVTKPPSKPLAKSSTAKPSGPAAKTDTSWFAKPVVHAAPVKKPSATTAAASSSPSSAPKPTNSSSTPAGPSSSSSNVFQQALSLTGSSSTTLGKRPISAVDGSNPSGSGGKKKKTISWRDHVRPERGLEDVRVFVKAGWEIQFEGTHDQTLAQLDKDEGRSMKGHLLEDPMELKDIEDELIEWYEPRPLLITPDMLQNIYPYTGLHASDRLALNQGTLETIYLSPADIPESPAEPDPNRIVEDGPATRYYEAVVDDLALAFQQPLYAPPPPAPASAPLGLANLDLSLILSQLNSGSLPVHSSNAYSPAPPLPSSSSSPSYYPGIPPPSSQNNNEYNHNYAPPPPSSYNNNNNNNQYGQPGPSSYTREGGGGGGGPLPPQQQMHESSFGKRKGPGGDGRGGKKGRQHEVGGGGGGGGERPWGNNDGGGGGGGGGFNARDPLERERKKRGPCRFFASGRCAKGSTCEFRH